MLQLGDSIKTTVRTIPINIKAIPRIVELCIFLIVLKSYIIGTINSINNRGNDKKSLIFAAWVILPRAGKIIAMLANNINRLCLSENKIE